MWRRIVADPVTGYAMDAVVNSYTPTAEMARVVRARDGRCRAPACDKPAHGTDIDHVRERRDGGPTSAGNLQCLCRRDHSKKTRRHWTARIDRDGVTTWTLPDGTSTRTFPMDYREHGIHALDPAVEEGVEQGVDPASVQSVGRPPTEHGVGESPATTSGRGAEQGSGSGYDSDPLTGWRNAETTRLRSENRALRERLAAERAAHRALCAEHHAFRAEHPPF